MSNEKIKKEKPKKKDNFYRAKTKISKENAEKEFEKILTKFEIAEIEKEDSDIFLNKIQFGKLFIDQNDNLIYILQKAIERDKGKFEKNFIFENPEQAAFSGNDIDLMSIILAYEKRDLNAIGKNSMAKIGCIFIGLSVDFAEKLTIKDATSLFMLGLNLFFGS